MNERLLLALHLLAAPACGPSGAASILRAAPRALDPRELDPSRPELRRWAAQVLSARELPWNPERLSDDLELWASRGIRVLVPEDAEFPENLRLSPYCPALVTVRGSLVKDDGRALTVVGTRRNTNYGEAVVRKLVAGIAPWSPTVVSGLAFGTDRFAHRQALKSGLRTVAVLGQGLAVPLDRAGRLLAEEIEERGAVLSPFLPDAEARSWTFPFRNRLLSGLSQGVVVVESGVKGGSMITAKLAAEEGREVFAVPGSIFAPESEGCHQLISDGAQPALSGERIAEALRWNASGAIPLPRRTLPDPAEPALPLLNDEERAVLEACPREPAGLDATLRALEMPPHQALAILAILEMQGLVRQLPGGRVVREIRL